MNPPGPPRPMRRRALLASAAGLGMMSLPQARAAIPRSAPQVLYAGVGAALIRYEIDDASGRPARLIEREAVMLPQPVGAAALHRSRRWLAVATSNAESPRHGAPLRHALLVFRVAPGSGRLAPHGEPLPLPSMAVHLAIDPAGTRLLATCYEPSAVLSWRLGADGRPQGDPARLGADAVGIFAHQAAFSPRGNRAVVCARGNDARPGHAEDRGSLTALTWRGGAPVPTDRLTMPPGLGPRNLVFHPSRPLLYVAMERGNALYAIGFENGRFAWRPAFAGTTLAAPDAAPPQQRAGAIALHPQGHALYVANRSGDAWPAGENNVAVYRIDPDTGLPRLRQHVDARGIEPRSLALDAGGTLLAVGNQFARPAEPAGIALFCIAPDGRLADADYAVPSHGAADGTGAGVNWVGFATPPA